MSVFPLPGLPVFVFVIAEILDDTWVLIFAQKVERPFRSRYLDAIG